jgi:hypothetical protein
MIRLALLALLLAAPAQAEEMAFYMKNGVPRAVAVELYSQDRQTVWPGGEKVYLLEKGEKKSVPVSCQAGETICWGAWLNGDDRTAWGVGPGSLRTCDDCCAICTAKSTATVEIGP